MGTIVPYPLMQPLSAILLPGHPQMQLSRGPSYDFFQPQSSQADNTVTVLQELRIEDQPRLTRLARVSLRSMGLRVET